MFWLLYRDACVGKGLASRDQSEHGRPVQHTGPHGCEMRCGMEVDLGSEPGRGVLGKGVGQMAYAGPSGDERLEKGRWRVAHRRQHA